MGHRAWSGPQKTIERYHFMTTSFANTLGEQLLVIIGGHWWSLVVIGGHWWSTMQCLPYATVGSPSPDSLHPGNFPLLHLLDV